MMIRRYNDRNISYNLDSREVHLSMSNENPAYVTDDYINNIEKIFQKKHSEILDNN